jgi:hypothetical protein
MSTRIVDYKVISGLLYAESDLASHVSQAMSEGWEPFGGVSANGGGGNVVLYQAMVKREEVTHLDEGPELESGRID